MSSYYEKILATGEVKCIDEEIPFEIPQGWEWCRLSAIVSLLGDGIHGTPEYSDKGKVYFINGNNLSDGQIIIKPDTKRVTEEEAAKHSRCLNQTTILVSINGTIGNVAFYSGENVILGKSACYFNLMRGIEKEYVKIILQTDYFLEYAKRVATGSTIKNVPLAGMRNFLVPIPVQREQLEIIEKKNTLIPLIQRYDSAQIHLDDLNSSLNSYLQKSILQEAIQGKLVPQIAEEGTAEELLAEIRKEKERLVKEGKLKKSALNDSVIFRGDDNKYFEKVGKTEQDITDEIPFEIPDDWKWCRIGSVLNIWSARRVHERDWRSSGIPFYRAREIGKMADWGHVDNDLFIEQSLYDEFSKSGVPQIGDLMMTAVGTLGKTYVVETNNPFYYKDGSVLCIGNPFRLNPYYLKLFFESSAFANQYLSESDGTTVATLTMVRLNRYLIPVPPLKEQTRIVEKIKTVTSIMSR